MIRVKIAAALIPIAMLGLSALGPSASAAPNCSTPGSTVSVDAATMRAAGGLQALVTTCSEGTSFVLPAGRFDSFGTVFPKIGDRFIGAGAASTLLLGSKPIASSNFTLGPGGVWVDPVDVVIDTRSIAQSDDPTRSNCAPGYYPQAPPNAGLCEYPDVLFMDGHWLIRVLGPSPAAPCTVSITAGQYCIDELAKKIYLGSAPTGHLMTFAGAGDGAGHLLMAAFENTDPAGHSATGVTISDLTVSEYANTDQSGGVIQMTNGWTVRNIVSSNNHACGLGVGGSNAAMPKLVQNSTLTYNGKLGFCGGSSGATLDHNTVTYNNQGSWYVPNGAGGGKASAGGPLVLTNNVFSYNRGNGFSSDVGESQMTISGNTVSYNTYIGGGGDGIHIEVSCFATITGNTVFGNTNVGILILNSHDVTVGSTGAGNTVGPNGTFEIKIQESGRQSTTPACGSATSSQNDVALSNTVIMSGTAGRGVAMLNLAGCVSCFSGVRFDGNRYSTGGSCSTNKWVPTKGTPVNFTTWQKVLLQDAAGSCS